MGEQNNARAVSVRGLTRRFGQNTVLHGLDIELEPGSFTALLGRSGSGKGSVPSRKSKSQPSWACWMWAANMRP